MIADLPNATLAQRLTDSGMRSTPHREVVYEVILAKRDHPTAEEVFDRVKARMPTISLATVRFDQAGQLRSRTDALLP
jgi:Fur family peroxide stress response transcriptional regulator